MSASTEVTKEEMADWTPEQFEALWIDGSIHTPQSPQKVSRKLAKRGAGVTQALSAMKAGASLHLFYQNGRSIWRLSTGIFITPEVADAITRSPNVVGVGNSLFGDAAISQTFRWINPEDRA